MPWEFSTIGLCVPYNSTGEEYRLICIRGVNNLVVVGRKRLLAALHQLLPQCLRLLDPNPTAKVEQPTAQIHIPRHGPGRQIQLHRELVWFFWTGPIVNL